jgi:hypothetical protein
MADRKDYELTDEQFDELLKACRPVAAIMLQCLLPSSPQENANRAWCALGDRLGFDGMTVKPSNKGQRFFTAAPRTTDEVTP